MTLATPSRTSALLRKFGWRFSRELGQNFLIDNNVLKRIIEVAEVSPVDTVLEIGTGIGTLTVALAAETRKVITVEIDRSLLPVLAETLSGSANVVVLRLDAMDLTAARPEIGPDQPNKLVANLPYAVAAPIIIKSFRDFPSIQTMTVMVQKEIAERILAAPGNKNYGAYTIKLSYFAEAKRAFNVSRHVFMPEPNVDSTVIKLIRRDLPPVEVEREKLFELVEAAFAQRRKQLLNALARGRLGIEKTKLERVLADLGLNAKVRAEELSLQEFARLTELIHS